MSRVRFPWMRNAQSFPRVSGDEPGLVIDSQLDVEFSPRERG